MKSIRRRYGHRFGPGYELEKCVSPYDWIWFVAVVFAGLSVVVLIAAVFSAKYNPDRGVEPMTEGVTFVAPPDPCGLADVVCPDEQPAIMGVASWYSYRLPSGYDSTDHLVCASRDFPRRTTITVTNAETGVSVDCLVTDYGPDASVFPDRVVDLSPRAFRAIAGSTALGTVSVHVEPRGGGST